MGHPRPGQTPEITGRATGPANANTLPRVCVLIVDDDDDARDLLADVLRRAGHSVVTARHGREAIERLRTVAPELILLDVVMPVMDGASFRQEQRRHRDWIRIPTIVMTGAAEEPMLDVAVEETLRKPISAKRLVAIAAAHCGKSAAEAP